MLLLVLACGLVALALREDVAEEVEASSRTARVMLAVSELPDGSVDRVQALIERGGLRHLDVALAAGDRPAAQPSALGWLTGSLGSAGEAGRERRLVLGDDVLIVRPNPASEVSEIVEESPRACSGFSSSSLPRRVEFMWLIQLTRLVTASPSVPAAPRRPPGWRRSASALLAP